MSGNRALFVGDWVWDSTLIEKWYDIGPSDFYHYTPQSEGVQYSISVTGEGVFFTYQNGSLMNQELISDVLTEGTNTTFDVLNVILDCNSLSELRFWHDVNDVSDSVIILRGFPYDFNDSENKVKSNYNYFSKLWRME